jgi:hypothetical protein
MTFLTLQICATHLRIFYILDVKLDLAFVSVVEVMLSYRGGHDSGHSKDPRGCPFEWLQSDGTHHEQLCLVSPGSLETQMDISVY